MPTRITLQVEGAIALRTSHHWLERIECATCVRRLCPCHTSSFLATVAFMEDALFTELRPKFSDFSICRLSRIRQKFVEIETSLFRGRISRRNASCRAVDHKRRVSVLSSSQPSLPTRRASDSHRTLAEP